MTEQQAVPKRTLSFAARTEHLADIRQFVRESALAMGASADCVASLVLATDELSANVIMHGYRGQEGTVEIEVERQGENVIVRVRDRAPIFDSTLVPIPDLSLPLDRRPLGGLGVYLARRVVDEMSHRVGAQGGNELTLVKRAETGCD